MASWFGSLPQKCVTIPSLFPFPLLASLIVPLPPSSWQVPVFYLTSTYYFLCLSDVSCLAYFCVCHLISYLCPFLGFLPDFHGSCSAIACLLFCPFSHHPGRYSRHCNTAHSAHSELNPSITFPTVCSQTPPSFYYSIVIHLNPAQGLARSSISLHL